MPVIPTYRDFAYKYAICSDSTPFLLAIIYFCRVSGYPDSYRDGKILARPVRRKSGQNTTNIYR
jgi:hypothetical protein